MSRIQTFVLDQSEVAPVIYRDLPHVVTPVGLIVEQQAQNELARFMSDFMRSVGAGQEQYFRIDAFVADGGLQVIEINNEVQDGWGVSLNLLRAAGKTPAPELVNGIPEQIIVYNTDYMPEFKLAQREASLLGRNVQLPSWRERQGIIAKGPYESKMYLARFSRQWVGSLVSVPKFYSTEDTPWEDIPEDVVFKFCHKYGPGAQKARYSVVTRKDLGKGRFMRRAYEAGEAVAQERTDPLHLPDGSVTQAIILCAGSKPVAGYLQVAPPGVFIINDKTSAKGPLVFEK
jgi:hypothetical protein